MALLPGAVISGKWSAKRVVIQKSIGSGANGDVYLVRFEGRLVAMKASNTAADIAMEWAVLSQVSQKGNVLPSPLLMDDAFVSGTPLFFYLMEWVEGDPFDVVFPKLTGLERIQVVEQIFAGLDDLHRIGYAFCDIKPQNILIQRARGPVVRFVDVGGVTTFGRSVRQFTPLYDRGFWGLGGRQSEPAYDVVGVMLLFVCVLNGQSTGSISKLPVSARQKWLRRAVENLADLGLRPVLLEILDNRIVKADEAKRACQNVLSQIGRRKKAPSPAKPAPAGASAGLPKSGKAVVSKSPAAATGARGKHKMDWTERLMWVSLSMAFSAACLAWVTILR